MCNEKDTGGRKQFDVLENQKRSRLELVKYRNILGATARFGNAFCRSLHEME